MKNIEAQHKSLGFSSTFDNVCLNLILNIIDDFDIPLKPISTFRLRWC